MSKENDCEEFGNKLTNIYPARGGGGAHFGCGCAFCLFRFNNVYSYATGLNTCTAFS